MEKNTLNIVIFILLFAFTHAEVVKSFSDDIHDRAFFKQFDLHQVNQDGSKLNAPQIPSILSYKIHHHLYVNQAPTDQKQNNLVQDLLINAECDVQSVYDSQKNTFEIAVSYSSINKTDSNGNMKTGGNTSLGGGRRRVLSEEGSVELDAAKQGGTHKISDDGQSIEGEFPNGNIEGTERNDRFFIVDVEGSSGEVTGLKAENGIEEDVMVNWMTQQLVNDILPDLRKTSYENQAHYEDNLGVLKIDMNHQHTNDNHIHIKKSYNNDNYVSTYVQNITLPQQDYQRHVKLHKDGGIPHSCNSTYTFSHGSTNDNEAKQDGDIGLEALGQTKGHVKQNFELMKTEEDEDNLAREMWRYRNEVEMHSCQLHQALKASFKLGNGQHEPFETESFLEEHQVFEEHEGEPDYFYNGDGQTKLTKEQEEEYQQILKEVEGGNREFLPQRRKLDGIDFEQCVRRHIGIFVCKKTLDREREERERREAQIRAAEARAEAQRKAAEQRAREEYARQMAAKRAADAARRAKEAQEAKEREEQLKRERNDAVYSHLKKLASLKVFGSEIHVDSDYVVKYTTSSIHIDVMVNSHVVETLFKVEWENCKTKPDNWNQEKDITLFQVTFPLLGIIVIPVTAKVRLEYGYNSGLTAAARMCEYNFSPYFKGSLFASGEISILHVISAGIYAQGTFLDADLDFKIGSSNGKSYTSLEGDFRAFTLSIGAVWDKFKCSLKGVFSRRLEAVVDGNGGKVGRRALWPHWHFLKRISHGIRRVVHHVEHFVKKVAKIFRTIAKKGLINTFCKKYKGYKQIYSKASSAHHRTFFHREINIGL